MTRPRIIPVLLLRSQGLYKTIRFKDPQYVGDPINAVKIFNEKCVDELIVIDINAKDSGPDFSYIADIFSEAFVPMCYGGGVRSLDDLEKLFRIGVEKVCINTAASNEMHLIRDAAAIFGRQSIVVGLDAKKTIFGKYERQINNSRNFAKESILDAVIRAEDAGAGEIFLQSVDRDGTMEGYDHALVQLVADRARIPVIACGGASGLDDMARAIRSSHASAAAAGSFFVYHGRHRAVLITYPDETAVNHVLESSD